MQQVEKAAGNGRQPPSLRAELAAAVRWVNARRAELPAAVRAGIAVPVQGIAAAVESADAAGDRERGLDAIAEWRRYWRGRFEAVGG